MTFHSTKPSAAVAVMANSGLDPDTGLTTQTIDDKYLTAVLQGCQALPVPVPTLLEPAQISAVLDRVDGVILTGDQSNLDPALYGGSGTRQSHGPFDPQRDRAALCLISGALARGMPVLGLCRGFQEINVALGGTLRADITGPDRFPSHPVLEKSTDPEVIYGGKHAVQVDQETRLGAEIGEPHAMVNSVHVQAIGRLAAGLRVVAVSDDGLVEAFEHETAPGVFGVQWHPEYCPARSPVSQAVFRHFARHLKAAGSRPQAPALQNC